MFLHASSSNQLPSKPLTLGLMKTLDLFFRTCPTENEENISCRKPLDLQIRFCSFSGTYSYKEAKELAKKVQSFLEVQS